MSAAAAEVATTGRQVRLTVPDLEPTWCYSLEWSIKAADGTPLTGQLHGTLH